MIRKISTLCLCGAANLAALTAGAAFAGDAPKPATGEKLPGVDGAYCIVKPAPEPADGTPSSGTGQFKIGDTDVRISGSVTVDVGAGDIPAPRR